MLKITKYRVERNTEKIHKTEIESDRGFARLEDTSCRMEMQSCTRVFPRKAQNTYRGEARKAERERRRK